MRQGQPTTTKAIPLNPLDAIDSIATGGDVVAFLKSQHETIKAQFVAVLAAKGTEREQEFIALKKLLSMHEAAEEQVVHPAAKRTIGNGDAIVQARVQEETQAKLTLADLAKLHVASPEFEVKFRTFQAAVLRHAASEEREEFDKLEGAIDPSRLDDMKNAVIKAEKDASKKN